MRHHLKYQVLGLLAIFAVSSVVAAQEPRNQNRQRSEKEEAGGPAPVHDLNGTWRGPGEPELNNRIPAMTSEGQAKLKLNIPDPFSATSNDPWKTCDPFGMPRIVNNEISEIGFATMPNRVCDPGKLREGLARSLDRRTATPPKCGPQGRSLYHVLRIFGRALGGR